MGAQNSHHMLSANWTTRKAGGVDTDWVWRPQNLWCPRAGLKMDVPAQRGHICLSSACLFYSGPQRVGWCPPTLVRAESPPMAFKLEAEWIMWGEQLSWGNCLVSFSRCPMFWIQSTVCWKFGSDLPEAPSLVEERRFLFLSLFIYFESERNAWAGQGQRERERERKRQRIPSRLHALSSDPDAGLYPSNHEIMTWAEIKSWSLNRLSYPGAPGKQFLRRRTQNGHTTAVRTATPRVIQKGYIPLDQKTWTVIKSHSYEFMSINHYML